MPDEPVSQNLSSSQDNLQKKIVEALAESKAASIGGQPEILTNLALASNIFNANLAQQNAIANQQLIFQVELAALAKCIQFLLATDVGDSQAIQNLTDRILQMFDQFHSKVEERLEASQNQMRELMGEAHGLRPDTLEIK